MSKNVKTVFMPQFTNGFVDNSKPKEIKYELVSTDELKLPSFVFDNYEDAELIVAVAKTLKARDIDYNSRLHNDTTYIFRVLGLTDSNWF